MNLSKLLVFTLALLVTCALAVPLLHAQGSLTSGDIVGTVSDPSGAVVPGASVTLKSASTGQTRNATTNAEGFYRFSLLQPGQYVLTVTAPNMAQTTRTVAATIGQATSVNVQMAVAAQQQTVTVTAEGGVLQTDNGNVSTTFSSEQIALVPNPGNDLSYVAQTAPGAVMNTQGGYGNFSTYGLPSTANSFTLNGMPEMDPFLNLNNSGPTNLLLGKNNVQEATVVNNGYAGQYGGLAGAHVNYVTKGGTNNFHGNAEYYWDGRMMNANNYFNKQTDPKTPRPFVNANQYAASFGGPIKKDKAFFFVDTEGLWLTIPNQQKVLLPTAQFQAATLANLASTGAADQIPFYNRIFNLYNNAAGASRATPVNGSFLGCGDTAANLGLPSGFGDTIPCASTYQDTSNNKTHEWILAGRVDYNFSADNRIFAHFKRDNGVQATYTDPLNPVFNVQSPQPNYEGQLSWTRTLGNNSTNQLILAGSWYSAVFTYANIQKTLATMPEALVFASGEFTDVAGGAAGGVANFPQGRNVTQYSIIDDYSHTFGNHSIKLGVNFHRNDITALTTQLANPQAIITLSDLFSGTISSFTQKFPVRGSQPLAVGGIGWYIQDEWRVTSNLRLTPAVRFDWNFNPICRTNCFSYLVDSWNSIPHDATIPYNQVISPGHKYAIPGDYTRILPQPRLGFAWTPFGQATNTVIRGGFGLFGNSGAAGDLPFTLANQAPNNAQFTVTGNLAPEAAGSAASIAAATNALFREGFTSGASYASLASASTRFRPPSFTDISRNLPMARFQEWNFEVQQGLGGKMALNLNYVGNHGVHLGSDNPYLNFFDPSGLTPGIPTAHLATPGVAHPRGIGWDPRFRFVDLGQANAVSNYNGLTASLTRRFSALQLQVNYTWSHALDELSNFGSTESFNFNTNRGVLHVIDPLGDLKKYNYGNADYDVRHYLSLNWVWNAPKNFGPHSVLGGWVLSGSLFGRTGYPFTVVDSSAAANLRATGAGVRATGIDTPANQIIAGTTQCGATSARASVSQDPNFRCGGMVAGFTPVNTDTQLIGFQRRNQVFGPRFFNMDFSVAKNFHIPGWEGGTFGVGANFFNILNHPNFDQPHQDITDPLYGFSTVTLNPPTSILGSFLGADASPRLIQLNAKITF